MIRRRTDPSDLGPSGWSSVRAERDRRRRRRHAPALLLFIPLVVALIGAPPVVPLAAGDEIADAKAKQAELKKEAEAQKAKIAELNALQGALKDEISATRRQLNAIGADLSAVRKKIDKTVKKIDKIKAVYAGLIVEVSDLNAQLRHVAAQEAAKRDELTARRAELAERIRDAYDADRTSPLEAFLSSGTFTDMLAEMSLYIDVAEQDRTLARQINQDKEALAVLLETVESTRARSVVLTQEAAAQKRALDASLAELKETRAALKKLEKAVARTLRAQRAQYASLARNKDNADKIIKQNAAKQKALAREIDRLIDEQIKKGKIPSEFNGTFRWPMESFNVSGEYGCSSYSYYPPANGCAHFHNGIDLVASGGAGTPIKAAGAGTVVYIGWNWADGADPAWIVVIAHSENLRTWYAHMQPKRPVSVGQSVKKGQVIGYEGNTGNSSGAHLHWMVERNGRFVNPRLFL